MKPLVSIIVPNYQGKKIFPGCIKTLLKQDLKRLQIIFVDDGSTDGSLALAKRLYGKRKNVIITKTPQNCGYVGAMNHGLKFCTGDYVMTSNNDITYPKNWAREMYRSVKGKKKVVGGSVHIHSGHTEKQFNKKIKQGLFPAWNIVNIGGCMRRIVSAEKKSGLMELSANGLVIIPKEALDDFLYLPNYFAYGEDIELCWRLRTRGYSIILNTKARLKHLGGYTRKIDKCFNKKAVFHGTKNTIQNHLILYEGKNVLKLLLPFILIQTGSLFARPKEMLHRIKAYAWVLTHPLTIWKYRKEIQDKRTISDEKLFSIMTYKFFEPEGPHKKMFFIVNELMRIYCKIMGIRTFDIDGKTTPKINLRAVQ
ncbi:glycosyltransferase [Candidatus Woesearchaeota archaeon]|nr:glycosyltransferase [Candidatus Woesearchaeota archaeon]